MNDLEIHLIGPRRATLAERLEQFLGQGFRHQPQRTASEEAAPVGAKADPVAVTALVLSIPADSLAAMDLAERIMLREKVMRLISLINRIEDETDSEALIETPREPKPIASMGAD